MLIWWKKKRPASVPNSRCTSGLGKEGGKNSTRGVRVVLGKGRHTAGFTLVRVAQPSADSRGGQQKPPCVIHLLPFSGTKRKGKSLGKQFLYAGSGKSIVSRGCKRGGRGKTGRERKEKARCLPATGTKRSDKFGYAGRERKRDIIRHRAENVRS